MEILRAVDADRIRALRDRGECFWLDLAEPEDAELTRLTELLHLHPLAVEDSQEFGQRAKLDSYPHSALLVFYGAAPSADGTPQLIEVHLHITATALVTVTRRSIGDIAAVRERIENTDPGHVGRAMHGVLDALTDGLLSALDRFDDTIDSLQTSVAERATQAKRRQIFALRRELAELRRVVAPQRDLLDPTGDVLTSVPEALTDDDRHQFRDVYDHLDRAAGLIGSYREQLASLLDLYLTEVSNRMNEVMKRLTLIATVFLPLTFITGFFGQNFGWFLDRITPMWTFWVFGVGLAVASTAGVAFYLSRRS